MTKDELKQEAEEWVANEIGEKDLRCVRAYIDSAEPREKQIQEKDRKIAELEGQIARIIRQDPSLLNEELLINETYRSKVAELEQENAELSMNRRVKRKKFQDVVEKKNKQLTKAKEIIKGLLSYEQIPRDCLKERYRKLLEDAEQFLNSEVEK